MKKPNLPKVRVSRKPNHKEVTTVLAMTDSDEILRDLVDPAKYDEYRNWWRQASSMKAIPSYPLQLDFELNYSCNYSCLGCSWVKETRKDKDQKTWLDFKIYKEIIDDGIKNGLYAIRLNFLNEPLMRPDIADFIRYARKAGILDIYLSTNGSLLTEKTAENLIKSGLTRLQVSLDAVTEKTYQKVRQPGKLFTVLKNIENFLTLRKKLNSPIPLLRVNFVRTEHNHHELKKFIAYWRGRADLIGIQDYISVNKPILKGVAAKNRPKFSCAQPYFHLAIRYNGEILPCSCFFGAELPFAKFKTKTKIKFSPVKHFASHLIPDKLPPMTISEAWQSAAINKLRKIHTAGKYWQHPICQKCVLSTSHLE